MPMFVSRIKNEGLFDSRQEQIALLIPLACRIITFKRERQQLTS